MKIAMFTNTYLPHIGGVAKSVSSLEASCRRRGHEVRVIAPESEGAEVSSQVLRVPAIQHFNGSDFAVRLPVPNVIRDFMEDFRPDIIHSHHPFLLGDAALREAWKMRVPIVFTHHTLYERYTHYVPLDSAALKRAAVQLVTEYSNLCDLVVAPSESVAEILRERKVMSRIVVTPTGIDVESFAKGDGGRFRQKYGMGEATTVIGYVGRLAKEKNLIFLADAVADCLFEEPGTAFLLVGEGDSHGEILEHCGRRIDEGRLFHPGKLSGDDLIDAYAAIDCFVFSSQTETQGMVLAEAMAAGKPVVALDGPGVREIVKNDENGVLLTGDSSESDFSNALLRLIRDPTLLLAYSIRAREVAKDYDLERCVGRMLDSYQNLIDEHHRDGGDPSPWDRILNGIEIEWELLTAKVSAAVAMVDTQAMEARLD
jgi:1,2-diacylglycerol 3-alpha-glucosyltransferase